MLLAPIENWNRDLKIIERSSKMACPVCPTVGWLGGLAGGYFGIHPPQFREGKILSASVTASLISITIIALKALLNLRGIRLS